MAQQDSFISFFKFTVNTSSFANAEKQNKKKEYQSLEIREISSQF
jgi:hypothetical protein